MDFVVVCGVEILQVHSCRRYSCQEEGGGHVDAIGHG